MTPARPTSIVALLVRLLRLRMSRLTWLLVLLGASCLAAWLATRLATTSAHHAAGPARFASFNIEFFPKDQRQIEEAFAQIEELEASAIGLQEIIDTARFASEARTRLGASWEFVYQDVVSKGPRPALHIGVLYDAKVFALEGVDSRNETRIDEGTQPTLQVLLRERASGHRVTMLVIHFKALPEGRERRARQFAGLQEIVADQQRRGRSLVIMGDFNATELEDRTDLGWLSKTNGLLWATEELACSAFWERAEDCPTSRLDHILTWKSPTLTVAKGGCEDGCQLRSSCPIYRRVVSDHCPVVIDMQNLEP